MVTRSTFVSIYIGILHALFHGAPPESSRSLTNPGSNESAGASSPQVRFLQFRLLQMTPRLVSQGSDEGNISSPRKAKQSLPSVDLACELPVLRLVIRYHSRTRLLTRLPWSPSM
ncbi:hypothetical protein JB92DRAFT_197909 [Gautieria morchelliformis]|nr:hypothetical protein JB92DRAFT_197909 [Gautieria morchelliformis]